jgi:eukaryotic-like serine/threonine-protein kinase
MTENKYQRFGKYLILDHLVDGGMAKICRARFLGEQANRLVAVKMVQPQFSKDADFLRMFEDELKVCFGLIHPNIAQTYDYGMYKEQLYTAMELIEGANLKEYLDRLTEKKVVFPVDVSTYIISQVCQGLHYAHTFVDKLTGKPLNIIHRDISPHNIMLSFDGSVKVIDFGIAKAESNSEKTQAGTIKGKLSYLAPEYLEGLDLDQRYDQFAVGITLWELLCNRKLFTAKNDLAVLKLIQACKIPAPSSINPNVPKELDQIVLKALSKDRTQRFEDLDKFNRALVRFLYSTYPEFNATDLSHFATELFKKEIDTNKNKYVEYGKIDIAPYLKDLKDELEGKGGAGVTADPSAPVIRPPKATEFEFDIKDMSSLDTTSLIDRPASSAKAKASTNTQRKVVRTQTNRSSGGTSTSIRNPNVRTTGTRTNIKRSQIEQAAASESSKSVPLLIVAGLAAVIYFKADMVQELTGIDLSFISGKKNQERTISSTAPAAKTNPTTKKSGDGRVYLEGLDPYMEISINGKKISYNGNEYPIPVGQKVEIKIEKKGYVSFTKQVYLSADRPTVEIQVPELDVERIGLLSTSMNYNGYKIKLDINGETVEKTLPLRDLRIPAGEYNATLVNELLGSEKKINFVIEENKKFFLE